MPGTKEISQLVSMTSLCYIFCSAKHSKFERMSCCNRKLFYNRKAVYQVDSDNWTCVLTQYLWKSDDDYRCLFKKTVPLKILDQCSWPPEIMMVSFKCMTASSPFETIRFK